MRLRIIQAIGLLGVALNGGLLALMADSSFQPGNLGWLALVNLLLMFGLLVTVPPAAKGLKTPPELPQRRDSSAESDVTDE